MDIQNKVVVITGGVGGIAIAIARSLLQRGAKYVALLDLNKQNERGQVYVEEFEKEFRKGCVGFYANDVTNNRQFAEIFDDIRKLQTSVDILINNAGICNEKNVDLIIDTNFKATVNCTLSAIERMGTHRGGKGGTIVNVSSIAGLVCFEQFPIYTATKQAIVAFTCSLKNHCEKLGVRIMTVCPGPTETALLQEENLISLDFVGKLEPVGPIQSPDVVGSAVTQLIEQGQFGDVWVVEMGNAPYAVREPEFYQDRCIPIS